MLAKMAGMFNDERVAHHLHLSYLTNPWHLSSGMLAQTISLQFAECILQKTQR
jgi:hypothetical protein